MSLYERALKKAAVLHDGQYRKGVHEVPYITHVVSVAHFTARYTDDDYVIAAALLHDTIEDTAYTEAELQMTFGARVASFVKAVTEDKSLPRAQRKAGYVAGLAAGPVEAVLISACDMLHNLSSLIDERDHAETEFLRHSFHRDRVLEYEARLKVIRERLGETHEVVPLLIKTFTTYKSFIQ